MKKIFTLFTLLLMLIVSSPFAMAQSETNEAKIKAKLVKRGTGEKKRVKIKMNDGTSLKGYVSRLETDNFNLTDSKTGQVSTIAYRDVREVNKSGGISTGAIIGIAVAGTAAIILGSLLRKRICNESAC